MGHERFPRLSLALPDWVDEVVGAAGKVYRDDHERMRLVVTLARENVAHGGGPFGAAVFERDTGRLIAPGVNLVLPAQCSAAHAEIVACSIAQQVLGEHNLGAADVPDCELVTSVEPCAMCLGSVPWSGVTRVVCGARDADATAIGFDEGAKPVDWVAELAARGISLVRDVLRDEAAAVLQDYVAAGGLVYNGRA